MIQVDVALRLDALLGEGPVWLPDRQQLAFVDIKRGKLHFYDPASGKHEALDVGGAPSFVVPASGGELLVGSRNAVYRLQDGQLGDVVVNIPEPQDNRTNDATVDADGRLWFGTMDDLETDRTGAIWCWDGCSLARGGPEAVVTNGPAVSCAGNWLYHVDSGERTIWRSALGPTAQLGASELFVRLNADEGYPDGIIVDAEDCLWVALWDGWGVRRYSPAGELLDHIELPCARITKIALTGPTLDIAYVTTARVGLSEDELGKQPLAGSLFTFKSPAKGRVVPPVRFNNNNLRGG